MSTEINNSSWWLILLGQMCRKHHDQLIFNLTTMKIVLEPACLVVWWWQQPQRVLSMVTEMWVDGELIHLQWFTLMIMTVCEEFVYLLSCGRSTEYNLMSESADNHVQTYVYSLRNFVKRGIHSKPRVLHWLTRQMYFC